MSVLTSPIADEQLRRLGKAIDNYKTNSMCFVVSPIGKLGTATRKRADLILKHVIEPAASACQLRTIRGDHISESGMISYQVIEHLIVDQMVVADLTDQNPNVFYELAVRHAIRKPYVQIIQRGQPLPFDIASVRTIEIDHQDLDDVDRARLEITNMMLSFKNSKEVDSPISAAVGLFMLRDINRFLQGNDQLYEVLKEIRDRIFKP